MQVNELFVESARCPLGIDVLQPAFGWSFADSPVRMQMQTAYRIIVFDSEDTLRSGIVWDSGQRSSKKNVHILYEGPPLASRLRYYWKVQVWDEKAKGRKALSPGGKWAFSRTRTGLRLGLHNLTRSHLKDPPFH